MADGALEEKGLAAEILAYFVEHPETADNLEGVAGWRLLGSRVRSAVESTERILEFLVAHGFLRKVETKTGPFFQINPDRLSAAKDFLQEPKSSEEPGHPGSGSGERNRGRQGQG